MHIATFMKPAALAAGFLAFAAQAQQGSLELKNEVLREITTPASATAAAKTDIVPAATVLPGDEVIYRLSYRNRGSQPADKVVLNSPVPEALAFRQAYGLNAAAEVSVDGKAFGALETLTVLGADGKTRPASPGDVKALRWQIKNSIAPGESGSVSFRAAVK